MQNSLWIDREEYPFPAHTCPVQGGKMHYVDVGKGYPILMLHGSPTWSFTYRHLIKGLSPHFRCIAPDYLGFGLSDHPHHWSYKPEAHAQHIAALIEHLQLGPFALLVHDFGGPIGLSYALDHPKQVQHLILLNTWMWPLHGDTEFERMAKSVKGSYGRLLYERLNHPVRTLMPRGMGDRSKLTPKIHAHYLNALPTPESRRGAITFAKERIDSGEWYTQLWRRRETLEKIPSLIFWGMQDPWLRTDALERWLGLFQTVQMVRYQQAGHFVAEECGPLMAPIIEGFLTGHPLEYTPPDDFEGASIGARTVML